MQVVSKVEQQKRPGRFNIYIADEFSFAVSETVLIKFNLFKGRELTKALIEEIKQADQEAKALQTAYVYLSQQLRSRYEVKQKLQLAEINTVTIENILKRLTEERLIDDVAFAQSFVRTIANTSIKGPKVIQQLLYQKRITNDVIEIALTEYSIELQLENATKLYFQLAKRYQKLAGFAKQQKIQQAMLQKGYDMEIIEQVKVRNVLPVDIDQEKQNLQREAEKIWYRNRKFEMGKRTLKTKQALYNKGFQSDDINTVMVTLSDEND
ncbi:recombination regulator RecX [Periweissella fabalis]|uniref:Regulatory protein RecX n=1 Tax=Periweissella fabalis TaxID=1070421 RepID=A0A7X6S2R0_9LACO|nr:recombination regulator RecX [Periweissella fabalis]MCM0598681.1 recombination regulator RecX [Periweissella fabalis]NKZ24334.1 recombination regulator RecX [Periweissella fabalis]